MNKKNIADFYPLSPMQQGMLFHSLAAPDSGVYVEQVNCLLQGDFDETAFIRAWEMVMQRHPILRTGFLSAGVKEPVQLVYKQVTLPVVQEDWQALTTAEQESKLDAFTAAECVRGFDLSQPPLLRLALLKMAADAVRFVWTFHHILMDGWSLPILLQEVFAFYEMLHAGKMAKLPPTRPFRDYIIWLKKQNVAQAAAFWRKTLAGFTAPTPLSVRSSHQQMPDNPDYREVGMALSREQTAVLQSLARQHQLTLNTFVQGAWALLLHRYSGEADVLFGATVSGRPPGLPGSEMMVGLFINTLPVRVQIDNEQPVLAWLKALQANQLEQRQYEFSPLIDIQGWSDVPRGLPLFESILVFENYPIETVTENSGTGLTIADIRSVEQTNYPLTVVAGAADALHLRILYDCTQFTETAVSRMLDHLQNLLTGMADDPTQPVKNLPLLTAAEYEQLAQWNETTVPHSQERTVVQLVEAAVDQVPQKTAVQSAHESLTYWELNQQANRLAHFLIAQGVKPGDFVAICLERSPLLVVSALAALKTGAAYIPIDPTYPAERIQFMIEDAQPTFILTTSSVNKQQKTKNREQKTGNNQQLTINNQQLTTNNSEPSQFTLRQTQGRLIHPSADSGQANSQFITLDTVWPTIAQYPISNPSTSSEQVLPISPSPDSLAYVIYTSGSTGKPKGVLIAQAGLLNLIHWHRRAFAVTAVDRATQLAGPGFDASVWEIWPYLTAGATLCIPDNETRAYPERLRDWLVENNISITFLPTPLAEQTLQLSWPPQTSLRLMLTGGDQLHQFPPATLPFTLVNNYGPTENSVVTTSGVVPPGESNKGTLPTIGRPIDNTHLLILDAHRRIVPIGVPGELYIGGAGVAKGYLNRPELTAERFIPLSGNRYPATVIRQPTTDLGLRTSDFGPRTSDLGLRTIVYRTGDLVRCREDGEIEFLGRIDTQVKIRGFRIELGEIEVALEKHVQVKTAVVIAWETPTHEKRLVAYLQPAAGTLPEGDDLRAFLQQTLPEPMIPSTFIQLDALPLTANGKVDRRALPNPDPYVATGHREYVAPRDKIEVQLVHIWESVLETKPIGVLDSFFSLGGHSLLAVRLISQIEQALGQSLTLTDLFQGETIAALAQKLRQKRESKAANLLVPIQTKGEKRPLFFIHPSGGSVHWYMLLANYLGEERPFYGIQAQGMNGEQLPHDNLKTMAADYIALIRSTQPDGPFLIGSWSLGVIIAFEIARQLTAAGEEVTALIMLDQGPDLPHEEPEDEAEYLMDTFGKNVPLSLDRLRTMTPDKQIAHVFHEAQKVNWIMPDLTLAQFHLFVRMMQTHTAAWRDYVPQPYPGKIALFRADEQASANGEPDMGWSSLVAGGVTIIPVPGDHITMLQEPHVQVLADRLRNCLAEAEPVTVHEDQEIGRWEIRD